MSEQSIEHRFGNRESLPDLTTLVQAKNADVVAPAPDTVVLLQCVEEAGLGFLDVEDLGTRMVLWAELGGVIRSLDPEYADLTDLDVSLIRGHDRRITGLISQWAWTQPAPGDEERPWFTGIRYLSRVASTWECWAIFGDADLTEVERKPITAQMPALLEVARSYGLVVH